MGGTYTLQRGEMFAKLWLENLKERGHLKDSDLGGRIILEWVLGK
jgi:hypothetical protein